MNFERFISRVTMRRVPSPIRVTTQIAQENPHFINLAAGLPNSSLFPFKTATVTTSDGYNIELEGKKMQRALQYSGSQGLPEMLDFISDVHKKYHDPASMQTSCDKNKFSSIVTTGSQDGLSKVFQMLLNPEDEIIVDDPCYSGTIAALRPMGCKLLPVTTDAKGIVPEKLQQVIRENPKVKVLYTIPTGSNPTGASTSLERKQQVMEIARENDLVIIEDDPYYFLQFNPKTPSYQSMDTEGRVIRSDSLSKILSSGMRLGWISGANFFINKLVLHQQASTLHTSTFTQIIVSELFKEWKLEGFSEHVGKVEQFYKSQRDLMMRCLQKHLSELAEWSEPEAGMFFWIKLKNTDDTFNLVARRCIEKEIILLPGGVFDVIEGGDSSYIRASFSVASEQDMDVAFSRLAELLSST